jgi:hypothetical protein
MRDNMPAIDLEKLEKVLTPEHLEWVRGIMNSRTCTLRASRPPLAKKVRVRDENYTADHYYSHKYVYANDADRATAYAAFIWREVAFSASPVPAHHCMPVTSDFWLDEKHDERRKVEKLLSAIADVVLSTIPLSMWHGVAAWHDALNGGMGQAFPDKLIDPTKYLIVYEARCRDAVKEATNETH